MTIKELMQKYGMSIKDISDRFDIPYRTVQNWCTDSKSHRECPKYIVKMMDEILSK